MVKKKVFGKNFDFGYNCILFYEKYETGKSEDCKKITYIVYD